MRDQGTDILRFVLLRGVGLVYTVAFLVVVRQAPLLLGREGLTPLHLFLGRVKDHLGPEALSRLPTLFWLDDSDAALFLVGWIGLVLAIATLAGLTNAAALAVLWVLHVSVVNAGQDWYGYGWETLLCEVGFLAIWLAPLTSFSPRGLPSPHPVHAWIWRWLVFRIMLGAGLIKMRGDDCWKELTCLAWHYETQPNPHPLSLLFHRAPMWFHQAGALFNHLVELVVPVWLFLPRPARAAAGVLLVAFQLVLIASGNLAFLNWLTLLACLAAFDDGHLARLFPRLGAWLAPRPRRRNHWAWLLVVLVAWRSVPVVQNLFFRERQVMNRSFDPLHLVNTYGAFGSVGKERFEAVIQGTRDGTTWLDYEFPCKPGNVARRPCLITPYHLHLDWQMWFVPLQGVGEHVWLVHLVEKLLRAEPLALSAFASTPFGDERPAAVRVARYQYRFAPPGSPDWWVREEAGTFVRPLTLDDPVLLEVMADEGW